MKKTIRRKCKVDVRNQNLYKAKRNATKINKGDHKRQYVKVWDYCTTIKK